MIKELPQKLRALRMQYGYSQKEVADKVGVSPSIVSGYETGERTPSTEILLSLSYLYGVSTDYLLGRKTEKPKITIDVSELSKAQIAALNRLVESIRNDRESC